MEIFQAKTIQKIVGIPKHRYSYILMKIRIEPDVEKVIGTGNTNLFSFKKLMEFAIASTAIDMGAVFPVSWFQRIYFHLLSP
jgi:hypothetical protein